MEQREIKFRVFNTSEKIIIYNDVASYISFNDEGYINKFAFSGETIVMQYTGLKDKNGKEIYEGDVLHVIYSDGREFMGEDADYKDSVYYDKDCASFMIKRLIGADALGHDLGKSMEIIGNIYENPELLTKQNNP